MPERPNARAFAPLPIAIGRGAKVVFLITYQTKNHAKPLYYFFSAEADEIFFM
jgi:hypothetical protein